MEVVEDDGNENSDSQDGNSEESEESEADDGRDDMEVDSNNENIVKGADTIDAIPEYPKHSTLFSFYLYSPRN